MCKTFSKQLQPDLLTPTGMGTYCGPAWFKVRSSVKDAVFVGIMMVMVLVVPLTIIIYCYVHIFKKVGITWDTFWILRCMEYARLKALKCSLTKYFRIYQHQNVFKNLRRFGVERLFCTWLATREKLPRWSENWQSHSSCKSVSLYACLHNAKL